MNIDLNALVARINTNNDSIITKDEIKAYENKYGIQSIFANYFKTISNEVSVNDFTKNLQQITFEKETAKGAISSNKEHEKLGYITSNIYREDNSEHKFRLKI